MPRFGAGPSTGMPHMSASPRVACSKPATMRSSVDFPQPEAPMRQMNSPLRTLRLTSRSASMRWPCSSNCLLTPLMSMIGRPLSPMVGAPAQQPAAEQHHQPVGDEAGHADDDHPRDDDLGARELARLHDDGAEAGLHAGHLAYHDDHPGEAETEPQPGEDGRK